MVKSLTTILVILMVFASTLAHAAECTTKKEISIPSFSTPSGEIPSKVTVEIPSSLASVLDISVNKGEAADSWQTTGSILIDTSLFSNLGASMTYDTSSKTVKVTVGNNVGNSGMKMNNNNYNSLTGLITSMITCSYLAPDNYKNSIAITAISMYGLLSLNTAYAQSSTSCTQSGNVAIYMPVGWEAKVSDESNAANGKFVYTISQTLSPTKRPTQPTTPAPTNVPTKTPTKTPTVNPTKSPTNSPTTTPTKSPTTSPTYSPSKSPSKSPTHVPTLAPTKTPSVTPTLSPTQSPTIPFTAVISELGMLACTPKSAEVLLHSSVSPSDVDFYIYTKATASPSGDGAVKLKYTSTLNTWTQGTNPCTNVKIYTISLPSTSFDIFDTPGSQSFSGIYGFGLAYKGTPLSFFTYTSITVTAQDGLFSGTVAVRSGTTSIITKAYLTAVGTRSNPTTYTWTSDDGCSEGSSLGALSGSALTTFCPT